MRRLPRKRTYYANTIQAQTVGGTAVHPQRPSKERGYHPVRIVLISLFGIAIALSVTKLMITNYYATKGNDLAQILAKEEILREENDILQTKLAQMTSLSYIATQAQALGMQQAKTVVFLPNKDNQPLALENGVLHY